MALRDFTAAMFFVPTHALVFMEFGNLIHLINIKENNSNHSLRILVPHFNDFKQSTSKDALSYDLCSMMEMAILLVSANIRGSVLVIGSLEKLT